jgi:hypothetical protein
VYDANNQADPPTLEKRADARAVDAAVVRHES